MFAKPKAKTAYAEPRVAMPVMAKAYQGGQHRKSRKSRPHEVGKRVAIYRKALLDALFLTHWNLAVPHQTSVKNKATMTSMGM